MTIDPDTKSWIRTAADERAAAAGMVFDGERGEFACNWMEKHLFLYEGEMAGKQLKLLPCWRDFFMRLYGWICWSEEWNQWIRRFTRASFWGAKKNAKSPMCAAHNLYLLCADGEKGQKVYQAAANGEQARIAQLHAVNMVKQSPGLTDVCKIHQSTLQISHLPTSSMMVILSGDDSRGAKAKEGLNGSISYDEMHVVNREMEERTSRAGISRKEPINASFSTAGDDPSSVGSERCKYGRQVNSGERNDPTFLHVEYAAPSNVTEEMIDKNLEEYGKAANPTWGYIIKPSEFRADWERSKGNPREVARFKQYRLNIEVGSTNQWLDTFGWEQGQREYDLEALRGRDCFLGLDLSRTRDMTAACFLFPWPEESTTISSEDNGEQVEQLVEGIRVWPMFWLPQKTADSRDHLFPYRQWAMDGHIELSKGSVVDYAAVESGIREAIEKYELNVLGLYFDQTYAEELTQRLCGEDGKSDSIGCERLSVPQTIMALTPLAKEWERRVSVGMIQHPGNAVLSWQVGHCEVYTDKNQNIRPVKPDPNSGKSIDGIMATLDAMAGVISYLGGSVYERRGVELIGAEDDENQHEAKAIHLIGYDDDDEDF